MKRLYEMIYRWYAKRHVPVSGFFPGWEDTKDILILYESDILEKNPEINAIIASLRRSGRNVTAWGYVEKKEVHAAILPMSRILGIEDITWYQRPRDYVINDLLKQDYDLLLDLTVTHPLPMRYLSLLAKAGLRAGMADTASDLRIMLPADGGAKQLFEQIQLYLPNIKTSSAH
ncbi:MAG: hypothetical protein IJ581_01650 [Paludibacteraceae bacterium]|nr:hypothetical protein [Paludibacteraceae bacterium]